MSPDYLQRVSQAWDDAFIAESNRDYAEALRLYELVWGAAGLISATEKEGLRIEFGNLKEKIASLQAKVGVENGSGKVQQIPMVFQRTSGESARSDDGYLWGY